MFHYSLHLQLAPGPPVAVAALIRFVSTACEGSNSKGATRLHGTPRFGCIQFHPPPATSMWSPEVVRRQKSGFMRLSNRGAARSCIPQSGENVRRHPSIRLHIVAC